MRLKKERGHADIREVPWRGEGDACKERRWVGIIPKGERQRLDFFKVIRVPLQGKNRWFGCSCFTC